ncbi:MDR family MFS transporter [Roseomonas sp. BN140053]|uniref:MDR family MFS transporter n=1 Tax=Roseomonas sp. BN140053 TaxID=3391898 RepID=UPI0039EBC1B4
MPPKPILRRPLVLAAVMAAMFMIAIEATIVSTAMPQIASRLGDLHLYSWVFSSFLLTQTAATVVFGKLSDLFGRKPVVLVGIAIFLAGSVLCGLAWSMPSLILFRLIQGVGAGAIQPVILTVVGDLYPGQQRGKVQGYLASVWGVSSVLGPMAGGLITEHLGWPWIFWINLPIGLAAAAGFWAFLHESVSAEKPSVDVVGAALFTVAVASLMAALTEVGLSNRGTALAAGGLFVVSAALFVFQERRARDPMMDLQLWARRPIATANAATLLSGMAVIGLTTFLPMYVQGVLNQSALVAGFTLTVMVLGWPVAATVAAKTFHRVGLRRTFVIGAALLPVGAMAFVLLGPNTSPVVAGIGSLVVGLGMGFLSISAIVIIQDSVGWTERGSATASNIFSRNLGSTLGAAVLGGVLNLSLAGRGSGTGGVDFEQVRELLDRPGQAIGDAAVRAALGEALHVTFWAVFGIAVLTLVLALLVPRVKLQPAAGERAAEKEVAAE